MSTIEKSSSKEARAERLKMLRELAGLTRAEIEKKYGLSQHTLTSWEHAKGAGLTNKGVRSILTIYQSEHISCSRDWLLFGNGASPSLIETGAQFSKIQASTAQQVNNLYQDITVFDQKYSELISYEIKDNSMEPFFHRGDIVFGIRHYSIDLGNLIGKDCIIETKNNQILFRRLQMGSIPHHFHLISHNPDTKVDQAFTLDIEISSAAQVIWIRRGNNW